MCTVTVIPIAGNRAGGFRVACNRDESRARAHALPPIMSEFGDTRTVMPIDPAGGGTWIAANDTGLVFSLLNYNPAPADRRTFPRSRGTIIPTLLDCRDVDEAAGRIDALAPRLFGPFRLLVIDAERVAEFLSDSDGIASQQFVSGNRPLLFTSSGLGDDLVEVPRRGLFQDTLAASPCLENQDAFHAHRWPDRPHLSVCMSRSDARTVSYTTVDIGADSAVMSYWPAPPDEVQGIQPSVIGLSLSARVR